jgi:hypothetical protein
MRAGQPHLAQSSASLPFSVQYLGLKIEHWLIFVPSLHCSIATHVLFLQICGLWQLHNWHDSINWRSSPQYNGWLFEQEYCNVPSGQFFATGPWAESFGGGCVKFCSCCSFCISVEPARCTHPPKINTKTTASMMLRCIGIESPHLFAHIDF